MSAAYCMKSHQTICPTMFRSAFMKTTRGLCTSPKQSHQKCITNNCTQISFRWGRSSSKENSIDFCYFTGTVGRPVDKALGCADIHSYPWPETRMEFRQTTCASFNSQTGIYHHRDCPDKEGQLMFANSMFDRWQVAAGTEPKARRAKCMFCCHVPLHERMRWSPSFSDDSDPIEYWLNYK